VRSYGQRGADFPSNGDLDRKVELRLVESEPI
jgi:hypothetical protein